MKQRIVVTLAVAAVAVIIAIVGYLWRVFRIDQTSKSDAGTEDSSKHRKSKQ